MGFGIWDKGSRKCLKNRGFLERGHAQNLENFGEAAVELQLLPENSHQDVDADRNPHLSLQGVDGVAVEFLDPQVLFDPLEKQFHTPATPIELCDCECRKLEVVGQKHQTPVVLGVVVRHTTKRSRIKMRSFETLKDDRLIAAKAGGFVDHAGLAAVVIEVLLGTSDEERHLSSEGIQAAEVDVPLVHHIEGARLDGQVVEHGHIGRFSVSYADKTGNVASQVDQCMQLHRALATTKSRPRKKSETEVDGSGV